MGKKTNKPVWVSDDGQEFETEFEMCQHEASLKYEEHIDAYLHRTLPFKEGEPSQYVQIQRTRARNILTGFLGFTDMET